MKFIKIHQQNEKDFFLVNLSQITHIAINQKAGTAMVNFANKGTLTCFPKQARELLEAVSLYNKQVTEFFEVTSTEEEW